MMNGAHDTVGKTLRDLLASFRSLLALSMLTISSGGHTAQRQDGGGSSLHGFPLTGNLPPEADSARLFRTAGLRSTPLAERRLRRPRWQRFDQRHKTRS